VTLPDALREGIDQLVGRAERGRVEEAARRLSEAYRSGGPGARRAASSPDDVAAYLATRAPATYAAVEDVCGRLRGVRPDWRPVTLLDLGAGPGVASWAACASWPSIARVTLVEPEKVMVSSGKALAAGGPEPLRRAEWLTGTAGTAGMPADLVVASYLLGELEPGEVGTLVAHAWALTADTLIVVEPGTTAGYRRVLEARRSSLESGGFVLAPCPHERPCPLAEGDWCHFSVRLARSRTHRLAKGAERGFEDEKLSYVVLSRVARGRPDGRVIRRPDARPGHVVLDLCTPAGIERRTVSRRDGDAYRGARKLRWGDAV
jgi:ribosomal protein RSM22 (predicted rRNA methylase)